MDDIVNEAEELIDQEGVQEIVDLCRKGESGVVPLSKAAVVVTPITDENREQVYRLAMSMYLGESCVYCGRRYETIEDVEQAVFYDQDCRLACKACWDAEHPED